MKNYRLKLEACDYYDDKYRGRIKELKYWELECVSMNAIEMVEDVYINYGHEKNGYTDLNGWSDGVSHFEFKVMIPSTHAEHNILRNKVPEMMKLMQSTLNDNKRILLP